MDSDGAGRSTGRCVECQPRRRRDKETGIPESETWLAEYGQRAAPVRFRLLYWLAVVAVIPATVGILWSLPVPDEFLDISPVLNWGSAFLMAAVVYYFIISMPLAIGMLPLTLGVAFLQMWLARSGIGLLGASLALYLAGLGGLYLGHFGAGGWRAVFRDVQLMMIAPLWLLSRLYQRLGIPF